jgi:hypothetical protein
VTAPSQAALIEMSGTARGSLLRVAAPMALAIVCATPSW